MLYPVNSIGLLVKGFTEHTSAAGQIGGTGGNALLPNGRLVVCLLVASWQEVGCLFIPDTFVGIQWTVQK